MGNNKFNILALIKQIFLLIIIFSLASCHSMGVEVWQREILAQPDMQFNSTNLTSAFSQHFYFSKEASSGGSGFAGGGCGCN